MKFEVAGEGKRRERETGRQGEGMGRERERKRGRDSVSSTSPGKSSGSFIQVRKMRNREWGRNQGHRKGRLEHQPLGSWSKALLCGLSYKTGENAFSPLTAESFGVF